MASLSTSSASSFQRSSRYSTSTVRSFNTDSLHPRLHSQFGEETSISSITNGFEPESFSCCHGDAQDESSWGESFGGYQGYQGDRESFGGYRGDQQYQNTQGGNQDNWILGDDIQLSLFQLAALAWAWSGRWGTATSCQQTSAGSSLMKWLWWRIIRVWLFMRRRWEQMGVLQASLPISLCCQQTWTLCL
ncbi:uncharacterized protein hspb12 isoform X2 [Chanodichthys erythropterus]|uniref:uncharacterized protein hspb12 isoform X2 n=1 Tax=Chanodichthys erythropterus TaxID=933992 RepID=UPI00351DC6FB